MGLHVQRPTWPNIVATARPSEPRVSGVVIRSYVWSFGGGHAWTGTVVGIPAPGGSVAWIMTRVGTGAAVLDIVIRVSCAGMCAGAHGGRAAWNVANMYSETPDGRTGWTGAVTGMGATAWSVEMKVNYVGTGTGAPGGISGLTGAGVETVFLVRELLGQGLLQLLALMKRVSIENGPVMLDLIEG